ncbi:hypothetical protein LC1Hm_0301 [Halomicrobium sp. LC1Hm]|nr:hypothetical protein LC1Hm_0301 [Halomicrobium sp. LC1Hm]
MIPKNTFCRRIIPNVMSPKDLIDIIAVVAIISAVILTEEIMLGLIALLLLRILDALVDIRNLIDSK